MAQSSKPGMARILIDIPQDDLAKFKVIADAIDLSMMQLARRCIRAEIAKHEGTQSTESNPYVRKLTDAERALLAGTVG
jgi:hypothetical protein